MGLIVWLLTYCKTILQSHGRLAMSSLLIFNFVACSPGSNNGPGTVVNNYGGDKNDPGGYGGGGTGDGGGGQGIACSVDSKIPAFNGKLVVRDIFEAVYNSKLTLKTLPEGSSKDQVSPEAIKLLIASLKQYFGPALFNMEIGQEKFWNDFVAKISFVNENAKLDPTKDANSPIALPQGCKIVQIAFWDDSAGKLENGVLYVDKKHWRELNQLNKIALLAHEYFFKEARGAGYKNSDFVRSKVGTLFSTAEPPHLFKNWKPAKDSLISDILPADKAGFKFCIGTSTEDPSATLHLYQYKGADENQHLVIPRMRTSFSGISSLQGIDIPFVENGDSSEGSMRNQLEFTTDLFLIGDKGKTNPTSITPGPGQTQDYNTLMLEGIGLQRADDLLPGTIYQAISNLHKAQEVIWSSALTNGSGNLNLAILNPVKVKPSQVVKHNADTNPATIIKNNLVQVISIKANEWNGMPTNSSLEDPDAEKLRKAFIVLDREIQKSVEDEKYPVGFPMWNAALITLTEDLIKRKDEGYKDIFTSDDMVTKFYPAMLQRSKMNLLNENDYKYITAYNEEFYSGTEFSISKGRIQIRSKEDSSTFELTCSDYDDLYFKRASESPSTPAKETNLKGYFDAAKLHVLGRSNKTASDRVYQILSYLSQNPLDKWEVGRCGVALEETSADCDVNKSLYNDLRAFDVQVSSCSARTPRIEEALKEQRFEKPQMCVILSPTKSNRHYLLRAFFSDEQYGTPIKIDFIKAVAAPDSTQ